MSVGVPRFDRIIDLGCGDAPYYPRALPPTDQYIGIDLREPQQPTDGHETFFQGDALKVLTSLSPGAGDLITAVFAAHHISIPRLFASLADSRSAGAEFLLVDPVAMHSRWAFAHWALSAASSSLALLGARVGPSPHFIAFCLHQQTKFLWSRTGYRHVVEDFRNGQPRPEREIKRFLQEEFADVPPLVIRTGAMLLIAGGGNIITWLRAR